MNIRELIESVEPDGDVYFDMSDAQETRNHKSRATLVYMTPSDFLTVAEFGHDVSKAAGVEALVKQGTKFRHLPFLKFTHDGKGTATVVGHEGRHRARLLRTLGVQQMPVILLSLSNEAGQAIRWGSQDNTFDRVNVLPTRLRAEVGRTTIPMPKSVVFPN